MESVFDAYDTYLPFLSSDSPTVTITRQGNSTVTFAPTGGPSFTMDAVDLLTTALSALHLEEDREVLMVLGRALQEREAARADA